MIYYHIMDDLSQAPLWCFQHLLLLISAATCYPLRSVFFSFGGFLYPYAFTTLIKYHVNPMGYNRLRFFTLLTFIVNYIWRYCHSDAVSPDWNEALFNFNQEDYLYVSFIHNSLCLSPPAPLSSVPLTGFFCLLLPRSIQYLYGFTTPFKYQVIMMGSNLPKTSHFSYSSIDK